MKKYLLKLVILSGMLLFQTIVKSQVSPSQPFTSVDDYSANSAASDWQFMKYGNPYVDHYTGTVTTTIPIYSYKDKDFELPITISNTGNGFMPNIPTDILGLGWALDAGGLITRTVRGVPDDYSGLIDRTTGADLGLVYTKGFFFYIIEPIRYSRNLRDHFFSGRTLEDIFLFPGVHSGTQVSSQKYYETLSDIYHFRFGKYSGRFMIDKAEFPKVTALFNANSPKGEFSVFISFEKWSFGGEEEYQISGFKIITREGYTYTFGCTASLSSHSRIKFFGNNQRNVFDYNYAQNKTSWPITKIEAPNGRTIIFNYRQTDSQIGVGETYDAYDIHPTYRAGIDTQHSYLDSYTGETYSLYSNPSYYDVSLAIQQQRYYSTLESIDIDGKVLVRFNYREKAKEMIDHEYGQWKSELNNKGLLSDITIHNIEGGNNVLLKKCIMSYSHSSSGNSIYLLTGVDFGGEGQYNMDYYYQNGTYPFHGTVSIDKWGYYNKENNYIMKSGQKSPNYNYLHPEGNGSIHNYLVPSVEDAKMGMLQTITYPTGGKTKYEYEGHDFTYTIARNMSDPIKMIMKICENTKAGGLRIKKIKDYDYRQDSVPATMREFFYRRLNPTMGIPDTISSGNSLVFPRFINDEASSMGHPTTPNYARTVGNTHIEYSKVTEKHTDGSYIEYDFCDYLKLPDINDIDVIVGARLWWESDLPAKVERAPISRNQQRGQLLEKTFYDASGIKVYKESNHFDFEKELRYKEGILFNERQFYTHKTLVDDYPLVSQKKTYYFGTDSLVNESRFVYNSMDQLIETRTHDSAGDTLVKKTIYIHQTIPDTMLLKTIHFYSLPIKEQYSIIRDNEEILLKGNYYNYTKLAMKDGPTAVSKIYSTNLPTGKYVIHNDFSFEDFLELENDYKYNDNGDLIQATDKNGVSKTYLWGYAGMYPVAKIENATYIDIENLLGKSVIQRLETSLIPSMGDIQAVRGLQNRLKNALVTTYTYRLGYGISSLTDARGSASYYEYDDHGRLIYVKDDKGKVLESYEYHYQNQPVNL